MSGRQVRRTDTRSDRREIAEAYRSLRSTVKFATGERPIHSVLVVDVDRAARSEVAVQLATAFSEAGDRCVLIDADARTGDTQRPGLFDLMQGTDAVIPQAEAGQLVRVGPGMAGSPDALASDAFGDALGRLVEAHGFAIFSSAPLPQFADALAIAPRVDAVILVVTAGDTRRPRAIDARDALERVGARILGVVMVESTKRRFW